MTLSRRARVFRWRRIGRILGVTAATLLALASLLGLGGVLALRSSLPRLDGRAAIEGLSAPVVVTRDSVGVVDIAAQSRPDAARALGYLHAQDRFFQMDLQRRKAAGELSALLGKALLASDRDTRRHRFRMRARQVLEGLPSSDRKILEAYAEGVDAGLEDLKARPFEYFLLRQRPKRWIPEDTILTLYAMFLDLSLSSAETEEAWAVVRDQLPPALAKMLLPRGNRWEAPLEEGEVEGVVLPTAEECDLRTWKYNGKSYHEIQVELHDTAGSNNWAVAGSRTAHGGALLANDMHLALGLPNTWYRVRMSWSQKGKQHSVVGVTLPGAPALAVGSNGHVAWGFTNSDGDWADLVILRTDPEDSLRYRTPDGWKRMRRIPEILEVAHSTPDTLWVEETIWGPVWGRDTKGRRLALRWTAHDPETVNLNLLRLEEVRSVEEVVELAASIGIPQQNLVCADDRGRIAWTLAGAIPRRVGWDGRLPVSWAEGDHRWDGYLEASRQPRVIDPPEGLLWTANNRVTAGEDLERIGDGGYATGARARQIRDDLRALSRPDEKDMLAVQLDDRAVFLERWRSLALKTLERAGLRGARRRFLEMVRDYWSGRADTASVAYRLVRNFSFECIDGIYDLLTAPCSQADPGFRTGWLPYRHAVTWEILTQRPPHLLPPWSASWDDFVLQAIDRTMSEATWHGRPLSIYTWGAFNQEEIVHPFVHLAPWLRRWLAAPRKGLPGDSFMPRVQHRRHGASERLVVSPGREEQGIFHMPGGQCGHPLSPYFLAGHSAWETGQAIPLLPGPPRHRLELVAAR